MNTHFVPPGAGPRHAMPGGDHIAKVAVEDSEGSFEMFEIVGDPSPQMPPPHVSPWTGVMYLIEGTAVARVGEETYDVVPGAVVRFPAGTPVSLQVLDPRTRFVGVTSGVRAGQFFAEFADAVASASDPGASLPAMLAVAQRHGVGVAGVPAEV